NAARRSHKPPYELACAWFLGVADRGLLARRLRHSPNAEWKRGPTGPLFLLVACFEVSVLGPVGSPADEEQPDAQHDAPLSVLRNETARPSPCNGRAGRRSRGATRCAICTQRRDARHSKLITVIAPLH